MRIAFVGGRGYHSNYGGVENAIREISTHLAWDGELDVDVYGQGGGRWFERTTVTPHLTSIGAPGFFSKSNGNAVLAFVNCLYALIVRRPQVLLLFASGPSLLSVVAKLLRVKVIAALRAIDSQRDKWGVINATILRLGEFSALRIADECTVNSLEMLRHYEGTARNLQYIPNGATDADAGNDDVLRQFGLDKDRYILFAARLDPVKRLHLLLEAYRQLPEDCRMPLIVAGGNCKSPDYQRQLEALAVKGVTFIGHVGKEILDPLMRNCAVFILPSILEGMSNSLLAAMKSGRCVLCADVDANKDVVLGEPGALFKIDDVRDLTDKLVLYSRDAIARSENGTKMKRIALQNYNWSATADSYRDLILRTACVTKHAM